jgi:hypothetical protein
VTGAPAAQAAALRAAAAFLEQAALPGTTGLPVTAEDDGQLVIGVELHAGPPAARAAAVAGLAAAIGAPGLARGQYGPLSWVTAAGAIAGHRTRVTTTIHHDEQHDDPREGEH